MGEHDGIVAQGVPNLGNPAGGHNAPGGIDATKAAVQFDLRGVQFGYQFGAVHS
jgi:hypothetical protein